MPVSNLPGFYYDTVLSRYFPLVNGRPPKECLQREAAAAAAAESREQEAARGRSPSPSRNSQRIRQWGKHYLNNVTEKEGTRVWGERLLMGYKEAKKDVDDEIDGEVTALDARGDDTGIYIVIGTREGDVHLFVYSFEVQQWYRMLLYRGRSAVKKVALTRYMDLFILYEVLLNPHHELFTNCYVMNIVGRPLHENNMREFAMNYDSRCLITDVTAHPNLPLFIVSRSDGLFHVTAPSIETVIHSVPASQSGRWWLPYPVGRQSIHAFAFADKEDGEAFLVCNQDMGMEIGKFSSGSLAEKIKESKTRYAAKFRELSVEKRLPPELRGKFTVVKAVGIPATSKSGCLGANEDKDAAFFLIDPQGVLVRLEIKSKKEYKCTRVRPRYKKDISATSARILRKPPMEISSQGLLVLGVAANPEEPFTVYDHEGTQLHVGIAAERNFAGDFVAWGKWEMKNKTVGTRPDFLVIAGGIHGSRRSGFRIFTYGGELDF